MISESLREDWEGLITTFCNQIMNKIQLILLVLPNQSERVTMEIFLKCQAVLYSNEYSSRASFYFKEYFFLETRVL